MLIFWPSTTSAEVDSKLLHRCWGCFQTIFLPGTIRPTQSSRPVVCALPPKLSSYDSCRDALPDLTWHCLGLLEACCRFYFYPLPPRFMVLLSHHTNPRDGFPPLRESPRWGLRAQTMSRRSLVLPDSILTISYPDRLKFTHKRLSGSAVRQVDIIAS